jgi:hypothetical protein
MTSPGPAAPISPISPISTTRSAEILDVLDRTRQEAIVVFVSDHGDMLGERGSVVQDELLRGLGPRAADDRGPGIWSRG